MLPSRVSPSGRGPIPLPPNNENPEPSGRAVQEVPQGTPPGFPPEMPSNFADLFQKAGGGSPLREASTSIESISQLMKQRVLLLLEDIMSYQGLGEEGIVLSLKSFDITSSTPSTVDVCVSCTVPKGQRAKVQAILSEVYSKVVDLLSEYIDENDPEYKTAKSLSAEQQEAFKNEFEEHVSNMLPNITKDEMLSFRNGKPICSIVPSVALTPTEKEAIEHHFEVLITMYQTAGIFFSGSFLIHEEEDKEEERAEVRIQARKKIMQEEEKKRIDEQVRTQRLENLKESEDL